MKTDYSTSERYKEGKFQNTYPRKIQTAGSVFQTFKKWTNNRAGRKPQEPLPIVVPELDDVDVSSDVRFIWLGHSSLYCEIEGKRLLLDPILQNRVSFTQLAGPKRFQPSPLAAEDIPDLDAIIISHDHYDHLEKDTIKKLAPRTKHIIVPLGIKPLIARWGIDADKIQELDWWDIASFDGLEIIAGPAQHFSGRSFRDINKRLWCTWIIKGFNKRIFFSGDTGMTDELEKVGAKYGPFNLGFIKIGAYGDEWPTIHLTPDESVELCKMLQCQLLMPIHWATFTLSYHPWREPGDRLIELAGKENVSIVTPKIGESVELSKQRENRIWWKDLK
ncbi:MBL fold metallo-hydrolase [Patescibacteria group bacterium]